LSTDSTGPDNDENEEDGVVQEQFVEIPIEDELKDSYLTNAASWWP